MTYNHEDFMKIFSYKRHNNFYLFEKRSRAFGLGFLLIRMKLVANSLRDLSLFVYLLMVDSFLYVVANSVFYRVVTATMVCANTHSIKKFVLRIYIVLIWYLEIPCAFVMFLI
ncbi:hypothetical protein Lal_00011947 [Lupinus albus]|nr:hypothetical protein Lal_00011947 [Lupinus albus]